MNLADVDTFFSSSHWLLVAFIAPAFWALVNIIDIYFVGGVYEDEFDGSIISSFFQLIPWPLFFLFSGSAGTADFFSNVFRVDSQVFMLAFLGGILFSFSYYFYFKALFAHNDVALLQIIWNLAIVFVPLATFLFLGERLGYYKYLGMGIVFIGACLLSINPEMKLKMSKKYLAIMLGAVSFLSLSMLLEERAYAILASKGLGNMGFWMGFFFFSLGYFFYGFLLAVWKKRNMLPLIQKHYKVFLLAEGLQFFGMLASQRAIDISPSVSYVATIESFVPLFIIAFSFLILFGMYISGKKNQIFEEIYREQVAGFWTKFFVAVVMAGGVYLISR